MTLAPVFRARATIRPGIRKLLAAVGLLTALAGPAEAGLIGGPLLDAPDIISESPDIQYLYDSATATGILSLNDTALGVTFPDIFPSILPITNGSFSLTATIDKNGNYVSGTGSFTVRGEVIGRGITTNTTLLQGDLTAFGSDLSMAGLFMADFRYATTGGALAGEGFDSSVGYMLVTAFAGVSDFASSFTIDDGTRFTDIGVVQAAAVPEPSSLASALIGVIGIGLGVAKSRRRRSAL